MSELKIWIWQDEVAQGPYTVDQLYRLAMHDEINYQTLFWSEGKQAWQPLPGLVFDLEAGRIEQMIEAGIKNVQVISSKENDCAACLALVNQVYPIVSPPVLPPVDCRCVPWCRLCLIPIND